LLKNNVKILNITDVHNYPTRLRNNFTIPFRRTDLGVQDFYVRGLKNFNELPNDIKNIFSINLFKKRLREHFWNEFRDVNRI